MSFTFTQLEKNFNDLNQTIYTTGAFIPGSNKVYFIHTSGRSSISLAAPTVTGCGLTWNIVDHQTYASVGTPTASVNVHFAVGSPSSGALTVTYGGAQSNCAWLVWEVSGADNSGGASTIVQNNASGIDATGDGVIGTTLASFADATNNATVLVSTIYDNTGTWTPDGSLGTFTTQQDTDGGFTWDHIVAWMTGEDTSPSATYSVTGDDGAAIAFELAAGASGPVVATTVPNLARTGGRIVAG